MTAVDAVSIILGVIAVIIAILSHLRMERIANMELYEKLAIIDGYIDFIKTGQPVLNSGAIYVNSAVGQNTQYTLSNGKVINDIKGALELKQYSDRKLKIKLNEKINELKATSGTNPRYQELSTQIVTLLTERGQQTNSLNGSSSVTPKPANVSQIGVSGKNVVKHVSTLIMTVFGWIVGLVVFFGSIFYLFNYIQNQANPSKFALSNSPIDLAGVIATIGGLVLVGAFYKNKDELKNVGKLLLISSALFVVSFYAMEYLRLVNHKILNGLDWCFIWGFDIAFLLAGIALAVGLGYLIAVIKDA